jgi:hypothetical protein
MVTLITLHGIMVVMDTDTPTVMDIMDIILTMDIIVRIGTMIITVTIPEITTAIIITHVTTVRAAQLPTTIPLHQMHLMAEEHPLQGLQAALLLLQVPLTAGELR